MQYLSYLIRTPVRCFVVGVLAVLPLVITIAVAVWVSQFVIDILGPNTFMGGLLENLGLRFVGEDAMAYAMGWLIVLGSIFGLGVFVNFGAKRVIRDTIDALAKRIPILGGVYGTVRQMADMLDQQDETDLKGMDVVFCQFGQETGAVLLALLPTSEAFRIGQIDYHVIMVPTAPVPVGGALIFVPAASVRKANLSVDAFMRIYISMGVSGPEFLKTLGRGQVTIESADAAKPSPATESDQDEQPNQGQ
jgi:uncharacterized membrane protein